MKFKAKTKDCQLIIRAKASFGESIDTKELDRFARIFLRGFLKPKVIKKGLVEYTGPVGISLFERMKEPLTKRDFLFVIEQIVVAVQKLQANGLSLGYLEKGLQDVYINKVTKEVQFVYMPTIKQRNTGDIATLIESFVYSVKPDDEKTSEVVSRFVYFFRAMKQIDVEKIEVFIAKEDRSVVNTIKKQNAGQSGYMTNKQQHYYEHYDVEATGKMDDDDEATGLLDDEATGLLQDDDEATGLLSKIQDDEATGLLNDNNVMTVQNNNVCYAKLYRVLTDEEIIINKPVFRLGKERSYVDYFVSNNVAVSRSHADIITRGNQHFIIDLNSKNHTFVNGRELPAQSEIEIKNGDKLTLADEEFVFNP